MRHSPVATSETKFKRHWRSPIEIRWNTEIIVQATMCNNIVTSTAPIAMNMWLFLIVVKTGLRLMTGCLWGCNNWHSRYLAGTADVQGRGHRVYDRYVKTYTFTFTALPIKLCIDLENWVVCFSACLSNLPSIILCLFHCFLYVCLYDYMFTLT